MAWYALYKWFIPWRKTPYTLFLTQKSEENHLKSNHYNYDKNAHTYDMAGFRSPEVEMLWKILQEVNW